MWQRLKAWFYPRIRTLGSLEAYAHWAARYPPRAHNTLMQTEQTTMQAMLPDLTGKTVLDAACGTGRYGLLARQQGAAQVIGLDNSMAMLQRNPLSGLALASLPHIPLLQQSVDVILCGLAVGHVSDLETCLREMARILKPGGLILISHFHPVQAFAGGQRTFRGDDDKIYAVEHHIHLYSDFHHRAQEAGLYISDIQEPRLTEHRTAAGYNAPVVMVIALRN